MPSWFFSIGMRNQLGIARHFVLESSHEGGAWGQVHPALAIEDSGDGLLGLVAHIIQAVAGMLLFGEIV